MSRPYILSTAILLTLFGAFQPVRAAIVLDDFINDVNIPTPEHEDEFFKTLNVGPFEAERNASVFSHYADPVGVLDVNSLNASQATLILEQVNGTSTRQVPSVFQGIDYVFPDPVDLTKNGAFDAFFLDFHMNRGPVPPQRVRMLVHQDVAGRRTFWEQSFPLYEERLEPFTAVLPFAKFVSRGGGPFAPPFMSVPDMEIDFLSLYDQEAQWEIRLDSIRIGTLPTADYNGNGHVEQADLDLVLLNWGSLAEPAPIGWYNDFPKGTVDQAELDELLLNWGDKIVPPSVVSASAIPEPSTLALLVLSSVCACAWLKCRRTS